VTTAGPDDTVADALARRVPARRRGPANLGLAEGLRELGEVDRAVYEAVARTPTGALDGPVRRLSGAADKSRLWLAIAAVIAVAGGRRGRRAALEGGGHRGHLGNGQPGVKPIARRGRPDRAQPALFEGRHVPMPRSASFPSGHSASPSPSPTPSAATCRSWPCRSGCWRGCRLPRVTPASTTPATWSSALTGAGTCAMVAAVADRATSRPPAVVLGERWLRHSAGSARDRPADRLCASS
jgi:undecaprenyl-diphosphatase